jgi:hypothetical protein
VKHFEQLQQQWIALNDLEQTVPEKLDERAYRDMERKPWNDEDAWGLVVSGWHMQVRMARMEERQKVLYATMMQAQDYAESTRALTLAVLVAALAYVLLAR